MSEDKTPPRPPFAETPKPKPVVVNPSVPGIQLPNTPDGKDAPPVGETR